MISRKPVNNCFTIFIIYCYRLLWQLPLLLHKSSCRFSCLLSIIIVVTCRLVLSFCTNYTKSINLSKDRYFMAQVSKRWLRPDVERKIRGLLVECVARCRDQQSASNFIDVLLTDTEKLMIAKRIAVALMLIKGNKAEEIDDKLKVSLGTVYTVKAWLNDKGREYLDLLIEIAKRDISQSKKHTDLLDEALNSIPRWGTDWKEAKRNQWQKVKDSKVSF